MTDETLYKLSLEQGLVWKNRNQRNVDRYLTIPHQILTWDRWLDSPEYTQYRDKLNQLYDTDASYKQIFDDTAAKFLDKVAQRQVVIEHARALALSLEYLKEESSIACLWHEEGYGFFVYPGINQAIAETLKCFEPNIKVLQYNFKSTQNTALSFQSIIDASPAHIYWKDSNGTYLGCNEALLQYLNLQSPEEFVGKTDFDILDPLTAKDLRLIDLSIMTKGIPRVIKEIDNKCGDAAVFLSYKSPLRNHDNEIVGIIGNSINITAQEKAEKDLAQRTNELAVALEAKERFLRNMSHEIRTPLQAILAIPEGLKEQYHKLSDKEREDYIGTVVEANKRLMGLLSNLLDLSQLRQGKFEMEFKPENIRSLAEDVIGEFKYTHGNITLNVDQDVPETLVCDRFRIAYVIRNLIGNSIKHGGQSHPIYVFISSLQDRHGQYVKCTIKDEGVGIPVYEKEAVFDAFVESSKTRSYAGGTGLGLSVAKEIVQAHKGKIWVEDLQDGEIGARVSFLLAA
jgi:PAS domain S-box-containing protein